MKLIVISSKQGGGKTTLTNTLIEKLQEKRSVRAINFKFAAVIYKMHDYCIGLLKDLGADTKQKEGSLLQALGLWGRERYGENVWVEVALGAILSTETMLRGAFEELYFINDDCRFKNELDAIPEALRIRLECDRDVRKARCDSWRDNETHPSEIDLDDWVYMPGKFDLIFNTNVYKPEECADIILAHLAKGDWIEKRSKSK